jgi:hypothetical protein
MRDLLELLFGENDPSAAMAEKVAGFVFVEVLEQFVIGRTQKLGFFSTLLDFAGQPARAVGERG